MVQIKTCWIKELYNPLAPPIVRAVERPTKTAPRPMGRYTDPEDTIHHLVFAAMLEGYRGLHSLSIRTAQPKIVVAYALKGLVEYGYVRLVKVNGKWRHLLDDEDGDLTPHDIETIKSQFRFGVGKRELAQHYGVAVWVIDEILGARE